MHTESVIEAGRSAFQRGDWGAAYAALTAADDDAGLPIEDLERLATTAYLVGDEQRFVELMSRVHREAMQAGDPVTAAHAAFWVAFSLSDRGHTAQASGWLSRGEAALGSTPGRSAAQGYLLALRAVQQNAEGQPQAALEMFTEVHEYGRRFADPDLLAFGRLGQGQALVMLGEVERGVSYLDEVMVAVTAEEVSAMVSGLVYCGVIEACHSTFDVGRAREWTGALTQWCDKQPDLVPYRGDCLVHRAQILQLNGNWALAMTEADRARALLAPLHGNPLQGAALYEKAEVHRLRGELSQAEECYREAGERGHEAQPGLALLRLAQGRPDQGLAGIRRALDEAKPSVNRPRLLAAHVELSLAAGDVATARQFSDELDRVARGVGAPFLEALACRSQAAVLLAEGEPRAALTSARHAWQLWRQLDVPFEAARSRVLVGLASRRLGDLDTAQVELSAARTTLEQLGAVTELRALAQLDPTARQRDSVLTPRELEVLRLVAAGKSNRMIASDLVLSDKTVARHLANIFVKLDVTSRAAATAYAYQHQLV
ncbi:MAG TPA: LuxR C-terminal-related transcriptional regulator [Nocardioidaceae bacterium]|nr:LuxR C-terminal-related transcriptional regulator [Nocardioidaceae bacterium]